MTQHEKMLATTVGPAGHMIFNNPARHNAVSVAMWRGAKSIIETFLADPAIRVIVLSGAGGKAFVAGADISEFEDTRSSRAAIAEYEALTASVFELLYHSDVPTIAMIDGYCIGGGLALALCCDLRICSQGSRFGLPAARLGLGYSFTGIQRLVEIVGLTFAKEIAFTARRFDAEEAFAMGLTNRIVPAAALKTTVDDCAASIAANAPLTIKAMKHAIGETMKDPAKRDVAANDRLVAACFDSDDYIEGRRAFMEKRSPVFTGQ
jgi:enoyl-CoA hydratase/carnithine racemase